MGKALSLMSGLGLGAGLMYLLDPDRGKRRRALARDQIVHQWHAAGDAIATSARDLKNRTRGRVAEMRSRLAPDQVSDEVLVERVRAKLGRVVSHPSAIHVTADQGRVTLNGPILEGELDPLVSAVASVRAVKEVANRLRVYPHAGGLPDLQGGAAQPGAPFESMPRNWSPAARLLVGTAGGVLAAYGASRRNALGAAVGTVGAGMLARAATNVEMKRLLGRNGGRSGTELQNP